MTLNQIRNVVAIAERGSLRSAARALGVTQPAVTRSIRELEHELGVTLFERKATGMALTTLGDAFVRRASGIQHEVERVRSEMEQLKGQRTGTVSIGLSPASHVALLSRVIGPFEKRYPEVKLRVVEGLFPTMERDLQDGVIDFYVGPLAEDASPSELIVERLFGNTRHVFGRPGHRLIEATSLKELAGARWVVESLTVNGSDALRPLFASFGLPAPEVAVSGQTSLSTIVSAANSDLLAMLPQQWTAILETTGLLVRIPIRESLAAATICIVTRARMPLTPLAEKLADLFRRAAIHHAETLPGAPLIAH